ncbi:MAG: hypothetical protein WBB17_15890 [Saprospiraceae bacterium]
MSIKHFFYSAIIIALPMLLSAQDHSGPGDRNPEMREKMMEKVEAQRVAFITTKLDLSTEESTKFWPVYNEFSKKRFELRKNTKLDRRQQDSMNESDSKKALDQQMENQEKEVALKKNYYEKFKAILPAQKLVKLEEAEMEFNKEVLKKFKERRAEMGKGQRH